MGTKRKTWYLRKKDILYVEENHDGRYGAPGEKSLKDCMATLLVYSFQRRISIDKEIVKAAKITANRVDFGTPGMGEAKRLIREYYLGGTGR